MGMLHQVIILFVCAFIKFTNSLVSENQDELLNWCIAADNHKAKPGKEDNLHQQCLPWKNLACCTEEVTSKLHKVNMYNFTLDHCPGRSMSQKCREHFTQDNCFYECEPHLGFWVVEAKRKIATEQFKHVPLCASECDRWFADCANDYTCARNWPKDFKFNKGQNSCAEGAECKMFKTMYNSSKDFCENVWDHSFTYTSNDVPCMKMWFDSQINPNREVAEFYINKHFNSAPLLFTNFSLILVGLVLAYATKRQ